MLSYLIEQSRIDLANVISDLSKYMDVTSIEAYKEMIRVIRFLLLTRVTCLKLKPYLDN
jgi:hypothetical protein